MMILLPKRKAAITVTLAVLLFSLLSFGQGITTTGGATFSPGTPQVAQPPHITSGNPPNGTTGNGYSFTFTGTCPSGSCSWSRLSGTLPAGTTLDPVTGVLSATSLGTAGSYVFSVKFADNINPLLFDFNATPYTVIIQAAQTGGVFMVSSGGNNTAGCTAALPCNGDLAGFAAAQTAVKLLPLGSKAVTLHGLAPPTQEDLMDYVGIGAGARTGLHKTGTSLYDATWMDSDNLKVWIEKGSAGNPWDIDTYNSGCPYSAFAAICLWITENGDIQGGFGNPLAYKRLITPVPVMPRFFTPGTRIVIDTPAPQSKRTANCETDNPTTTSPGDVRGVTEGPFTGKDFGNDIGVMPYILSSYHYSGTIKTNTFHDKELRYYVKGYGRVLWELYHCTGTNCSDTTGTWVFSQNSLKNNLVAGAAPVPNWPCGTTIPGWIGGPLPTAGQNSVPAQGGVYRLPSTLNFASTDSGANANDVITWKNYPGESVTITGAKRITGLSFVGSRVYSVTLPASSWKTFETLYVDGVRRPRPIAVGAAPVHGYGVNGCPLTAGSDSFLCVSGVSGGGCTVGTAQQIANCQCGAAGTTVAGTQTKECTGGTPYQCFNRYKITSGDINASWHNLNHTELDIFEDWTMSRMRLSAVSGTNVTLTGPTGTTNNHGCQGGHHWVLENVKENLADGQWYLDQDADNNGVDDANYTLLIKANVGENLLAADIEVPQLTASTPLVSHTSLNFFRWQSANAGNNAGIGNAPTKSGLFFEADNWQPPAAGYADAQGMPNVTQALLFTNVNNVTLDGITVRHTSGWGIDFQGTSTHNIVQMGEVSDTGAGGIRFGTGTVGAAAGQPSDTEANVPQFNTVQEMLIDNIGRIQPGGEPSGIFLGDGHHNIFTKNEITNSYVGGIELCFYLKRGADDGSTTHLGFCHDNVASKNRITGQKNAILVDHAGIYSAPSLSINCPALPLLCNTIDNNVISYINSNYDLLAAMSTSHDKGIYLDQGSSNVKVTNNLSYYTGQEGIFVNEPQHTAPNEMLTQNNLIDNNVFAFFGYQNAGFAEDVSKGCLSKNGQNGSAVTFSHNICYGNFTTNKTNIQHLPEASWLCFADDLVTEVPCVQRWVFSNNGYWNKFGTNALQFGVCKAPSCPSNFNTTNFWKFGPNNGVIPSGWQAPYAHDGSGNLTGAGEDANSVAVDPQFISTVCGAEDFRYNHNFAAQGIVPINYALAGRTLNTLVLPTNVPDLFPVRPVVCSDYNNTVGGVPAVSLDTTSLSFGSQTIFTTSSSQVVTVTNTGTATLLFTSIGITGDFAQSNTCIPSLAASASCVITVTFSPTALGSRTGTLSIADNAAGSPQTVSLTGTGTSAATGADNRYCTSGSVVTGLTDDTYGTVTPAKLASCFNTALANTPSGATATPVGTIRTATDNATFVAALAASGCGDVIKITKGTHISIGSGYVFPAHSCDADSWITIQSSGVDDAAFPPEGTRTSPCWSGVASIAGRPAYTCPAPQELTARITIAHNNLGALKISGDHYRFIGLEITRDTTPGVVTDLIDMTAGTTANHHVIFDRMWIHGYRPDGELPYPPTQGCPTCKEVTRGIGLGQANNVALIDSYVSDIYCIGSVGQCGDAQAVGGGFGALQASGWGTYKIVNNHLEAAAEGMILGGANGPALAPPGCTVNVNCNVDVPTDIEVRRNFFFKPNSWDGNTTVKTTTGYPNMKNGFEIKSGARWLIEANVIQNVAPNSDQPGQAFLFSAKNPNNGANAPACPTCFISDLTVRYNYAYAAAGGIALLTAPADNCGSCKPWGVFRSHIHDNLVEIDVKSLGVNPAPGDAWQFSSIVSSPVNQAAIEHNTISKAIRSMAIWGTTSPANDMMNNWYFENNITPNGGNGILRVAATNTSCDFPFIGNAKGLLDACINTYSYQKNEMLGGNATNWPTDGFGLNNFFHTTSTVLFTNYNGGNSGFNPGNYQLLPTSPVHNLGTDSKDPGADIGALLTAISGVVDK